MKNIRLVPLSTIRSKLSLFVLLLLVATTLASCLITIRIIQHHMMEEVINRAESLSRSIASAAGYSSLSQDILGLDTLVFQVKKSNTDIEDIAIVGSRDEILVHSDVNKTGAAYNPPEGRIYKSIEDGTVVKEIGDSNRDYFEITAPIVFMNKNFGSVILNINKSVIENVQRKVRDRIALVFASILLAGTASIFFLSSLLTRPIKELAVGVDELIKGGKTRRLKIYSQDELGKLTESFNEMSSLITAQKDELSKYAQDLEESYVSTVKVVAAAIDARDHYTLGHSTRVARLSVDIGEKIGLSKEDLDELEIACLFHDVGKIKTPDSILLKEGKLDSSEYREMMRHPEYGAEILSKASSLLRYIPLIKHHHEWYDGTGYPDGLSGDKIPLSASIISIADVYDAMTSDRPYRKAFSYGEAIRMIQDLSGKQFAPDLVKILIGLLRKK